MAKYSDAKILGKSLKLTFDIDDYGLINMTQSQVSIDYEKEVVISKPKEKTLTEKVMSFFGGTKGENKTTTEDASTTSNVRLLF